MGTVMGVSAFYHDSAVCLVRDGRILAAAQEERFSRVVGDARLPRLAAQSCLQTADIESSDVDLIVFYEKPLLRLERLLENHLDVAPKGLWQWRMLGRRLWSEKLGVEGALRRMVPGFRGEVGFVEHHESHAASAFYPSPFDEAAVLTIDGVGEWATATWGSGRGSTLRLVEEMVWPASLGLLYSAVTNALGLRVNRDEYKVMGLAAYGKPRFVEWLDQRVVERADDGTINLRQNLLAYRYGRTMISPAFLADLGEPLHASDGTFTDAAKDLAASIQLVLEEQVLAMARHVARASSLPKLCLAGGVAYNCVANGRLRDEGPFDDIWIQPAAGDAGGAIGAALLGWYRTHLEAVREITLPDAMHDALLGPLIDEGEVHDCIDRYQLNVVARGKEADEAAATLLAHGEVVALASGRMEFGPRALGNRSILADPRPSGIQARLNERTKHRESYRPFAPAVLEEHASTVFRREVSSPYMLEVAHVRPFDGDGVDWRSLIQGAVHVDGTSRIQTVGQHNKTRLRGVLESFERLTKCPVLINTSFNDSEMPIVATATDACDALFRTEIEYLLLGDSLVVRGLSTAGAVATARPLPSYFGPGSVFTRVRKFTRRIPEAVLDLALTLSYVLVILPISLIHRAISRSSSAAGGGWRVRKRTHSDLSRLF